MRAEEPVEEAAAAPDQTALTRKRKKNAADLRREEKRRQRFLAKDLSVTPSDAAPQKLRKRKKKKVDTSIAPLEPETQAAAKPKKKKTKVGSSIAALEPEIQVTVKPKKIKKRAKKVKSSTGIPPSADSLKKVQKKKKPQLEVDGAKAESPEKISSPPEAKQQWRSAEALPMQADALATARAGHLQEAVRFGLDDKRLYQLRTSTEVKVAVADAEKRGMSAEAGEWTAQRWQRRERRRNDRLQERAQNKTCFQCRGSGHVVADCPFASGGGGGDGGGEESLVRGGGGRLCYKCGSVEHTSRQCGARVQGFPFASCFVCKATGHLAKDCTSNPNGVYPQGGCCSMCGSKDHLWKDCPRARPEAPQRPPTNVAAVLSAAANPDEEQTFHHLQHHQQPQATPKRTNKTPAKVIAF